MNRRFAALSARGAPWGTVDRLREEVGMYTTLPILFHRYLLATAGDSDLDLVTEGARQLARKRKVTIPDGLRTRVEFWRRYCIEPLSGFTGSGEIPCRVEPGNLVRLSVGQSRRLFSDRLKEYKLSCGIEEFTETPRGGSFYPVSQ